MALTDKIYDEIKKLPTQERLRIFEWLSQDIKNDRSPKVQDAPLFGLWSEDASIVDELVEESMSDRETRQLRSGHA